MIVLPSRGAHSTQRPLRRQSARARAKRSARRRRETGSKDRVYEGMEDAAFALRCSVQHNMLSSDYKKRMQLLEMVEEAGRRSWQRIKVIEELKDLEKSLRLYSGASHRRGGVRGGGRDRVKAAEVQVRAVEDIEARIAELQERHDAMIGENIQYIEKTLSDKVMMTEVGEHEATSEVVEELAQAAAAARKKYCPDASPIMSSMDESADSSEEETNGDSSESSEEPETTRAVLSAADPSLGVVDIGSLCLAFTMADDGAEVSLAPEDHTPIQLRAPDRDDKFVLPASLLSARMCAVKNPPPESMLREGVSDPFNAATDDVGAIKSLFGGVPGYSEKFLDQMAEKSEHLTSSTFHMDTCNADDVVYTMSGAGKVLSEGELQLRPNTYIVFDGTCTDVHLKNVTFRGGTVVFLGEGCRATLSNMNFCDTMVVVLQGAHVKLKHCSYAMRSSLQTDVVRFMLGSNFSSSAALACLVVDGQGSSVEVESTTISGGDMGMQVQAGGRLEAKKVRMTDIHKHGVFIQDAKSVAKLSSCTLDSYEQGDLWSSAEDVGAPDGAELVPKPYWNARDLKLLILPARSVGVRVTKNAHAELSDVTGRKYDCGLMATQRGNIVVDRCRFEDSRYLGCLVSDSTLSATKLGIFGGAVIGCGAIGGATVRLSSGNVQGSRNHGVFAAGESTQLHIDEGSVANAGVTCVQVAERAHALITSVSVRNSVRGSGIVATADGTHVRVQGCWLKSNKVCGVDAMSGGEAVVTACHSEDNKNAGYGCRWGGTLTVSASDSRSDACGVLLQDEGSILAATEVQVRGAEHTGFLLSDGSTARLTGCTVMDSGGLGMDVRNEGTYVHMQRGSMTGLGNFAVLIDDHSKAFLEQVTMARCLYGLCAGRGGSVVVEQCNFKQNTNFGVQAGASAGACSSIDVSNSHSYKNGEGGFVAVQGSQLHMVGCSSVGDEIGVGAISGGELHAKECVVRKSVSEGVSAERSTVNLDDCTCAGSNRNAVAARGEGAQLNINGGRYLESQFHVVYAVDGAHARVRGITAARSARGCGVLVSGKGSRMSVDGCTLEENAHDGGVALGEGLLTVERTRSVNNSKRGQFMRDDVNMRA